MSEKRDNAQIQHIGQQLVSLQRNFNKLSAALNEQLQTGERVFSGLTELFPAMKELERKYPEIEARIAKLESQMASKEVGV